MNERVKNLTVVLADDHRLVRLGFRRLLDDEPDITVVGEADSGLQAIELSAEFHPDVIVLDMAMSELSGLQAISEILRRSPTTRILVLSMYDEADYVRSSIRAGAHGYMLKNAVDVDLAEGVRRVAAGGRYFSPAVEKAGTAKAEDDESPLARLTNRERQVLELIVQARSNKEVASMLGISVNTVNVHRMNLMKTLDLHSTAEIVLFGVKHGLATLADQ